MRIVAISAAFLGSAFALLLGSPAAHAAPIPNTSSNIVEVQAGDSLSAIATAKGTTYLRLYYANTEVQDPNLIYPGEKLRIPAASEQLTERPLPANVVIPAETPTTPPVAPAVTPPAPTAQVTPTMRQRTSSATVTPTGGIWDNLAQCESGGNWSINTGNGFYGGLQFTLSSWRGVGGSGYPNLASRDEQIARAQALQARQGWGAWPACATKLGLL